MITPSGLEGVRYPRLGVKRPPGPKSGGLYISLDYPRRLSQWSRRRCTWYGLVCVELSELNHRLGGMIDALPPGPCSRIRFLSVAWMNFTRYVVRKPYISFAAAGERRPGRLFRGDHVEWVSMASNLRVRGVRQARRCLRPFGVGVYQGV